MLEFDSGWDGVNVLGKDGWEKGEIVEEKSWVKGKYVEVGEGNKVMRSEGGWEEKFLCLE